MDREQARKWLPEITAFANGKDIQARGFSLDWNDTDDPNWLSYEYRVKPETREWWLYPDTHDVTEAHEIPACRDGWIKVREVL